MHRRFFLRASAALVGGVALGGTVSAGCDSADSASTDNDPAPGGDDTAASDGRRWVMPDEGEPHQRTWMAFAADEHIWGRKLVAEVQQNLAAVATAIARFEPVSMLVRADDLDRARQLVAGSNVELVTAELDDLWIRDTGPVFVRAADGPAGPGAVDFNFNGWGDKQEHARDAKVAEFVAARAGVPTVHTDLVLEGGGIEVDGEGTAIITESCVLNDNRNPGRSKPEVEAELARLLGVRKVIWLPGIAGHDITDGHTDFYARFAGPGVVVAALDNDPDSFDYDVTRRHLDILRGATDAQGRSLQVEVLAAPTTVREKFAADDFAAGYINFYVCNGAVIAPEFGDPVTDPATAATLARLFPGRQIVQVAIDGIAAGGGGIHCATQQQPAG
ncbi:agmatine/peptidylarginine deiminase [Skermania piniformis]|uniref:Agmatine deiminase family protein n=1 Tax=Skermania pinensis TaxID=39122 RepID=A0ABX8S7V3_9ACTN|nr:agmatine deiminase family protein [Skermania piniformis]QXQ12585.1 agmatine deiminase family protein [Skermania piniformis]